VHRFALAPLIVVECGKGIATAGQIGDHHLDELQSGHVVIWVFEQPVQPVVKGDLLFAVAPLVINF
jgi:hypothetical protein